MVTTSMIKWGIIPDIIGDGVSEQEEIMTVICETKGAQFDGTDCVGELDDSTVHVSTQRPNIYQNRRHRDVGSDAIFTRFPRRDLAVVASMDDFKPELITIKISPPRCRTKLGQLAGDCAVDVVGRQCA